MVLLLPTPAACTSDTADPSAVAAHYSLSHVYIPAGKASCIPGVVYEPKKPLTQPPGLVVMLPALGQNALGQGLHTYAHAFASSGLSVLLISAPGSLVTSSLDPDVQRFLLNCGKQQEQPQQQQQQQAVIPAIIYGSTFRAAVSRYVQLLVAEGRVDAGRVAYWGAEWGAVAAVQAAVEQQKGAVQALILQVSKGWSLGISPERIKCVSELGLHSPESQLVAPAALLAPLLLLCVYGTVCTLLDSCCDFAPTAAGCIMNPACCEICCTACQTCYNDSAYSCLPTRLMLCALSTTTPHLNADTMDRRHPSCGMAAAHIAALASSSHHTMSCAARQLRSAAASAVLDAHCGAAVRPPRVCRAAAAAAT
jgi:hypothetical protein